MQPEKPGRGNRAFMSIFACARRRVAAELGAEGTMDFACEHEFITWIRRMRQE